MSVFGASRVERIQSNSLLRRAHAGTHHGTDGANKTNTKDQPRVGGHETITPSVAVKGASGDTDDSDTKTSVQESVIQVGAFEWRHAAIFSGLAVEDKAVIVISTSGAFQARS